MLDNFQGKYLVMELDPTSLAAPFKVQTSWYVITGAPCSGKTTLIDQLANAGYTTLYETARLYYEMEIAKGRTSQEIRDSGNQTQVGIFEMQQKLEAGLSASEVAFLDRGLPDSLTFHRVFGLNPDSLLPECCHFRYKSVFVLERLPVEREIKLGPEDEITAHFIDQWLERDYHALGYSVLRVPVMPPQERLAFVLEKSFMVGKN